MVSSPAPTSAAAPSAASSASALQADQLELVRLARQLRARVVVGDRPAGEALVVLDDLAHPGLDRLEVLGRERGLDVEVVVEAVLDRRPDAELRVGEQVLDRLGHHVRRRVAQDGAPVGAVDPDRLDLVAGRQLVREVAHDPVDPGRDHVGVVAEQLPRPGAVRHGLLIARVGVDEDDLDVGHEGSCCSGTEPLDRSDEHGTDLKRICANGGVRVGDAPARGAAAPQR